MKNIHIESLLPFLLLLLPVSCRNSNAEQKMIAAPLERTVMELADGYLSEPPVTVTASVAERSAGGIHDFFSEGDYWWPDPANPDGPYIRRDGESNPDNFSDHRHAMIRFSRIVGTLTSAWLLSGRMEYADAVAAHVRAWFVDPDTMMNANLEYAQAIKGVTPGRGIGIIDTIHLVEVAQSLICLEEGGALDGEILEGARAWFSSYLEWMTTHPNGIEEMNAANNHGTCWAMQAAAFARFTGNAGMLSMCSERFKTVFLPGQMASDGSFPLELDRTKPYGYSLFNLDAMAALCEILSTPGDDLWEYTTSDGRCMLSGVKFMLPYVQDKDSWPYEHDVMHWDDWPVAQPFLFLAWKHFGTKEYYDTWLPLDHFPVEEEVVRNLPLRNPIIWF